MALGSCGKALVVIVVLSVCFLRSAAKPPPWAMSHKVPGAQQGKFEGDILLDEQALKMLQNPDEPNPQTRNIIKSSTFHWPNGVVPYIFDPNFDNYPHERTMILSAIGEVHKVSCARFVQRTSQQYYIKFIRAQGCSSHVGCLKMAAQPVSIGQGCAVTGTILHELLHVLGFFHTSSRPDRDSYVVVKENNVASGYEHNFWKYDKNQVDEFGAPYELDSLMHPPKNAWSSNNENTIESKRGSSVVLGNPDKMTQVEIGQLNTLYGCSTSTYPVCYKSLGMQDNSITDSMLSASSYKSNHNPHQARLHLKSSNKGFGAWCPSSPQEGQYLQIDLGSYKYIKGFATQGFVSLFGDDSYVTKFNFNFSFDGSFWYDWKNWYPNLIANYDGSSVEYIRLPQAPSMRYLRIIPTAWVGDMCLRLEIYGCEY